MKFTERKIHPQ